MFSRLSCQRPYHVERTWSRQLPEVKLRRVPLVLGWVTAWEYGMLLALHNFIFELEVLPKIGEAWDRIDSFGIS